MGRPASYDKHQLLDQVVDLFWQHGLTATPVSMLVKTTGVHAASLYSAFGSKQGLMLAALDHYAKASGERMQQRLSGPVSAYQKMHQMFYGIMEDSLSDSAARGCFLVNVAVETANSEPNLEIYQRAQDYLARARARIRGVLEQGQSTGEISPHLNCEDAAVYLQSVLFGIRVMGRTRASREMLQTTIDHGLQSVFGKRH